MKPERAQELYTDYADGTLSPSLRLALEQHFVADPAARADYHAFQRTLALLDTGQPVEVDVPIGFRARVLDLAAQEQAKRENTPARRALLSVTGWFGAAGPRRAGWGALSALAAASVIGVLLFHASTDNRQNSNIGPSIIAPHLSSVLPTAVLRGVSLRPGVDGNTYHDFDIHLPSSVPHATLSAYVVTATDQITDPAVRTQSATPALAQPQPLASDESMQLPVALLRQAPAGTTLNVLVSWTPDDPKLPNGAEVMFTPAGSVAPLATASVSTDAGSVYDALQAVAAAYGVSVVADVPAAPPAPIAALSLSGTPLQALQQVAAQAGMTVAASDPSTFVVSARK